MSTTYRTRTGDTTFRRVALRVYGQDSEAWRIETANPGVTEPITENTLLVVPNVPNIPQNRPRLTGAQNENQLTLLIDNERFEFWESLQIVRSMDSMDTIQMSAPFESDVERFRNTFRPMSFKPIQIGIGEERLFTGTMVDVNPDNTPDRRYVHISGYSVPGVLNDCTSPAEAFPIEFARVRLPTVVEKLIAPFGLTAIFDADPGAIFERIAQPQIENLLPFFIDLAQQRNLIISSTSEGELLFTQSVDPGNPVARLDADTPPVTTVRPNLNPQDYYSTITGLDLVIIGTRGGFYTVRNPLAQGINRPYVFVPPDANGAEVEPAVRAKAGRIIANIVSYTVTLPTWRDPDGNLWRPNTTMELRAPGAMIYDFYEFLIRTVEFNREGDYESCTLTLTLPGVFKGEFPERFPWDT